MNKKFLLLVLPALLTIMIQPISLGEEKEAWAGADALAEDKINEIAPDYEPWFNPVWEPPSGEIETLLFSLQAAIGALIIGYFFGYYRAKNAQTNK